MKLTEFKLKISNNKNPVIVDLWAPWCAPCRAMEPAFKQVSQKYIHAVDVWKINADESPEILKSLGVMGIPTVIGFAGGNEIWRKTGMQSAESLELLFNAALHQQKPDVLPPAPIDRIVRSIGGIALILLGVWSNQSIVLIAIGAGILFSGFYDRCPIYRAIAPRIKTLFAKKKLS